MRAEIIQYPADMMILRVIGLLSIWIIVGQICCRNGVKQNFYYVSLPKLLMKREKIAHSKIGFYWVLNEWNVASPCTGIIKRLGYVWPSWEQRKIPEVICYQDKLLLQLLGAPDEHSNLVYLEIKNMFILGKEQNISIGKKNSSYQEGETLRRIFYINFKNRQTFIDRKILAVMFSWQDVIIF